ncbi:MAG: DUF3006 domain-containing protein [Chitinophagales bacterium]
MKNVAIVDRFEGETVVIQINKITMNIPRCLLPEEAREGDVITISCSIDNDLTRQRKRRISALAEEVFED